MAEAPETTCTTRRRWLRLTPDRVVWALLPLEGLLILSEWFRWFPFNQHKGWTVLVAIAGLGAVLLLMFLWFLAALVFRLRFQFSILSLLVLTVVVAVPFSWLKTEMNAARRQRETVEWIKNAGGEVVYDYEFDPPGPCYTPGAKPPGPAWLRNLLGDDVFADVTAAAGGLKVVDAGLERLKGLPQLKYLGLHGTKVSDAGLEHLKGLTQLRLLDLDGTQVSDAGLEHLKGLTQLRNLRLDGTRVERRRAGTPQGIDPTPRVVPLQHLGQRRGAGTSQGIDPAPVSFARWHQGQRRGAGTPQGIDPTRVPGPHPHQSYRRRAGTPQGIDPTAGAFGRSTPTSPTRV